MHLLNMFNTFRELTQNIYTIMNERWSNSIHLKQLKGRKQFDSVQVCVLFKYTCVSPC